MAARTQQVFPPDAGSTNNGAVPSSSMLGRGILRTGDIRHKGDITGPNRPTATLAPATMGFNSTPGDGDSNLFTNTNATTTGGFGQDGEADGKFTTFSGGDASGEGFDPFSSKLGKES